MSLREQLIDAVRSKDNEKVSNVLNQMTADEVNEKDEDGRTALYEAYLTENVQAMNLLLDKPGIDLNTKLEHGIALLAMKCLVDDHEDVTDLLATPGIDPNAKDDNGCTPIFYAAGHCNIKTLEVMLESPHVDLDIKLDTDMGLEDTVGIMGGNEEERKICVDMIREAKLKRIKVSESEDSKGTEIEKTKTMNLGEGDNSGEHTIDTKDSSEVVSSTKKSPDLTTTEKPSFKFARIVFDATDLGKGFKTLRLNAATPMREVKKLFPKHLGVAEETFILCFNNQEVKDETLLELFGSNLDGEDNIITIVKTVTEDKGDDCDKLESSQPESETDPVFASNAQNEQKEVNEVKKAKRSKPKCIRASCKNQGQHRCSRCKAVYYCKQKCLEEDWSKHKMYCDYVYEGSKDNTYEENHDDAYEENSVPEDSTNEDQEETGKRTVEEMD